MNKKNLGQFYTTNYKHILQNMYIPDNVSNIIEPFAGNCDLLNFIEDTNCEYNVKCYDIDPKKDFIIKQDTLLNPPDLDNAFIITNPPYLARNKSSDKGVFNKYNTNDLYKCFIQILINSNCLGGIIIIPLNFLCSIRKADIELRENFVKKYDMNIINIFEEQVFDDTSYSICSFQFTAKNDTSENISDCYIYPCNKRISFVLNNDNNYTIGGKIYNLEKNTKYKIDRAAIAAGAAGAAGAAIAENDEFCTNILAKCIDDNINSKIGLIIVDDMTRDKYIDKTPNLTARSYAILVIKPKITLEQQEDLAKKFNIFLNEYRDKYNSLFLTNYRESNTIARKRISFGLVYDICNYLLC
jgi:hypothetical protein